MVRPYPDCSIAFSLDPSMYKWVIVLAHVLMVSAAKLFSFCCASIFRYEAWAHNSSVDELCGYCCYRLYLLRGRLQRLWLGLTAA